MAAASDGSAAMVDGETGGWRGAAMAVVTGLSPLVQDYLAGLPKGIDSYAECVCKGSAWRSVLDGVADPTGLAALVPAPVAALLVRPPAENAWLPETHINTLILAVRQARCESDDALLKLTHEQNLRLLGSAVYRILFKVAAPSWVLSGAEGRWGAFHRGIVLRSEAKGHNLATSALLYPPKLMPRLVAGVYLTAFQAAVELAGGKQVKIEITNHTDERTDFRASWS